jgi:hypothetical protein
MVQLAVWRRIIRARDDYRHGQGDGGFIGRVRSPGGATIPSDETACAPADPSPAVGGGDVVRVQLVVTPPGERTWTVVGADHRPVEPVEAFLEYLRVSARSPNTVKL